MTADVLTTRELNRATLARQLLVERSDLPVLDTVRHLVGMQAQVPLNPYLGLWSRLDRFAPDELGRLLVDREVVRLVVLRGTIHLVTVDDALLLRPLSQPILDAELARHPEHGPHLRGVDLEPVLTFARTLLADGPLNGTKLRAALAAEFPACDAPALAYACRNHLAAGAGSAPGRVGPVRRGDDHHHRGVDGAEPEPDPSVDDVVLRAIGAYGPSTVADLATWSRLTGLREVVDRLRPRLRVFHDERGREVYDLPDAPRPPPDTPVPPRFLPEYDNVLLAHADRSRFAPDEERAGLGSSPRAVHGTVLIDGRVRATWRVVTDDGGATRLVVDHVGAVPKRTASTVEAEGRRMMAFLHPDTTSGDVRLARLD